MITRVAPSKRYTRRGDADLVVEVPVTYSEAALGSSVEVPTPYGERLAVKVAPGSETGKLLKLKGQGAPRLKGTGKGDLLARLRVTVPKKLTKAEKDALENYAKVSREQPREGERMRVARGGPGSPRCRVGRVLRDGEKAARMTDRAT